MNKIANIFLAVFVLVLAVGSVSAVSLTAVSGTITDADSLPVAGADVAVTCTHDSVPTTKNVVTNGAGMYNALFSPSQCDVGDVVVVEASSGDAEGSNDGEVAYNQTCRINTSLIDVQIPEFGVIATGAAMVGAIAGLVILRRKN